MVPDAANQASSSPFTPDLHAQHKTDHADADTMLHNVGPGVVDRADKADVETQMAEQEPDS